MAASEQQEDEFREALRDLVEVNLVIVSDAFDGGNVPFERSPEDAGVSPWRPPMPSTVVYQLQSRRHKFQRTAQ